MQDKRGVERKICYRLAKEAPKDTEEIVICVA
jgi:hypothetical protein